MGETRDRVEVITAALPSTVPRTTDPANTGLSLQFLRLYGSASTVASVYVLRAGGCPIPTLAAWVSACRLCRN